MDAKSLEMLVTREMPYGKYKGRILADLPGNYLNWFAREGFPSGELGRLLARSRTGMPARPESAPAFRLPQGSARA